MDLEMKVRRLGLALPPGKTQQKRLRLLEEPGIGTSL
jgi:hypothetical protein